MRWHNLLFPTPSDKDMRRMFRADMKKEIKKEIKKVKKAKKALKKNGGLAESGLKRRS